MIYNNPNSGIMLIREQWHEVTESTVGSIWVSLNDVSIILLTVFSIRHHSSSSTITKQISDAHRWDTGRRKLQLTCRSAQVIMWAQRIQYLQLKYTTNT